MQMPSALFKSAKIDGTSNWRFLWRVMVPMNKNTIATIAILTFIAEWNAFLWPNLVAQTDKTRLISSGLIVFRSEASSSIQLLMAGSCVVLMPMVIFYIIFRKKILEGVASGGIKG
jgi:multiple sugar transport system permease protein